LPAGDLAFSAPATVRDAVAELAEGEDVIAMSGGTSVALLLKHGLIDPRKIVWLAKVPGLRQVEASPDGGLSIGALTTLRQLAASAAVRGNAPALADAAGHVGNPRVRSVATLGGALAHGDPRQDVPPVLLALEATVRVAGPSGERDVPIARFHTGFMETVLGPGEIVTRVLLPPAAGRRATYARFAPASEDDYPTVSAAASVVRAADGRVARAVLAVGGAGPTPLLIPAAERLSGAPDASDVEAVAAAAEAAAEPVTDQRGSARYKKAMVRVWAGRVLHACLDEAPGQPAGGPPSAG
jgi:aerobic carbon-monoxide dehydrogenase medium subunit